MEGGRGGGRFQEEGLRDDALDPDGAILTPDTVSPTGDRDGLSSSSLPYAAERIFMRQHDMWGSTFGAGMRLWTFSARRTGVMRDLTN
jgi:hypothetical protein